MDFNRLKYHFDKAGVKPNVVLDIGANASQWCKEFKKLYSNTLVHQFEANEDMKDKLEGTFDIVLLGSEHKDHIPFYCGGNTTGNSIYKENTVYYENCDVKYLTMFTLDGVLDNKYEKIDLIKIDVQGAELDILRGGSETLAKTDLLLLEVSYLPYNKDAPLVTEVYSYLDSIGFIPIDILEKHYFRDIFIQSDTLFARKDSVYVTKTFN